MRRNNTGFIQIILVLVVVGLISGAYFFGTLKNKSNLEPLINDVLPKPSTLNDQNSDPTVNWKIYTNNEFSFKYPNDWLFDGSKIYQPRNQIEMWVYTSDGSLYNDCMKVDNIQKIGELTVKSFSGATTSQMCDPANALKRKEKWIVKTNSEGFAPGLQYAYKDGDTQAEKIFDQILSTFEFVDSKNSVPKPILDLFSAINTKFNVNLVPVEESEFYSQNGMITKKSWKINLLNTAVVSSGKNFTSFLRTQLLPNDAESGGIGGGGTDGYQNDAIKCFHTYMSEMPSGKQTTNFLSCAEK